MNLLSVLFSDTGEKFVAKYIDDDRKMSLTAAPPPKLFELISEMQRAILPLWGANNNGTLLGYELKTNKNGDKLIKFHQLAVIGQLWCANELSPKF